MLLKDRVEWWQALLGPYEAVRGRMTQVEFCEREGVSHNAFVHRTIGRWPPRRRRTKETEEADPGAMLSLNEEEPSAAPEGCLLITFRHVLRGGRSGASLPVVPPRF